MSLILENTEASLLVTRRAPIGEATFDATGSMRRLCETRLDGRAKQVVSTAEAIPVLTIANFKCSRTGLAGRTQLWGLDNSPLPAGTLLTDSIHGNTKHRQALGTKAQSEGLAPKGGTERSLRPGLIFHKVFARPRRKTLN
jgi:hypothetical protein